jgi:hypothetical protein
MSTFGSKLILVENFFSVGDALQGQGARVTMLREGLIDPSSIVVPTLIEKKNNFSGL